MQVQTDATRRYLGHIEDAQATSDSDVAAKLQQSTTDFHKMQCMWKNGLIKRRMKFRMLRRFQQQMMFGGAVSWMLDAATRRALNSWSSDKTAIITGRSRKEENKRRTLNAALTIRRHRRRRVGLMIGTVARQHPLVGCAGMSDCAE